MFLHHMKFTLSATDDISAILIPYASLPMEQVPISSTDNLRDFLEFYLGADHGAPSIIKLSSCYTVFHQAGRDLPLNVRASAYIGRPVCGDVMLMRRCDIFFFFFLLLSLLCWCLLSLQLLLVLFVFLCFFAADCGIATCSTLHAPNLSAATKSH